MNEEKMRLLAQLVLLNHARIDHLSGIVQRSLARDILKGKMNSKSENALAMDFEQLETLAKDAEAEAQSARKVFDLE